MASSSASSPTWLLIHSVSFGEVYVLSPWRLVDYWTWTREPNPDDFVIR